MNRFVVLHTGQSNVNYPNRGETGSSITAVGLFTFYWGLGGSPGTGTGGVMVDLVGKTADLGGADYTIGRLLDAAGIPCAIIDLTATGTTYNEWVTTPGTKGRAALDALAVALGELVARYPGDSFQFVHLRNQGTSDALINNQAYQEGWAAGFEAWHAALEEVIETTLGQYYAVPRFIIESNPNQPSVFFPGTIQAQQALAAGPGRLIQLHDDAGYEAGLHMIATSCNITVGLLPGTYSAGGFQWLGTVAAQLFLIPYWRSIMTISHGAATRTAVADTVVDRVDAGAGPGKLVIREGSTVLATVTLADPAFGPAVNGVAPLLAVPLDDAATASGGADNFLCQDSDSNTVFFGSVTATGGGGDLTLDSVSIVDTELVTITGGGYTAPP